jgi:4-oxalocrotonate tautomerase
MPIVTVRIAKGRPLETKRKLATALTATIADTLDVERGKITVLIEEYDRENWATGGELQVDGRGFDKASLPDVDAIFKKPSKAPPRKAAAKSRSRR